MRNFHKNSIVTDPRWSIIRTTLEFLDFDRQITQGLKAMVVRHGRFVTLQNAPASRQAQGGCASVDFSNTLQDRSH